MDKDKDVNYYINKINHIMLLTNIDEIMNYIESILTTEGIMNIKTKAGFLDSVKSFVDKCSIKLGINEEFKSIFDKNIIYYLYQNTNWQIHYKTKSYDIADYYYAIHNIYIYIYIYCYLRKKYLISLPHNFNYLFMRLCFIRDYYENKFKINFYLDKPLYLQMFFTLVSILINLSQENKLELIDQLFGILIQNVQVIYKTKEDDSYTLIENAFYEKLEDDLYDKTVDDLMNDIIRKYGTHYTDEYSMEKYSIYKHYIKKYTIPDYSMENYITYNNLEIDNYNIYPINNYINIDEDDLPDLLPNTKYEDIYRLITNFIEYLNKYDFFNSINFCFNSNIYHHILCNNRLKKFKKKYNFKYFIVKNTNPAINSLTKEIKILEDSIAASDDKLNISKLCLLYEISHAIFYLPIRMNLRYCWITAVIRSSI
jgi:hypothetical protein